jgi:PleD family two-component response regulator
MRVVLGGFDAADAEPLRESLSEIGCVTRVVTIAKDILACAGQWKPAVLLLNPLVARGFDVCRCLKNDPEQSGILVLMVAELQDVSDIERAVEAGTDDFLSMPVEKAELLKRVSNMLRISQIMNERDGLR